MGTFFEQHWLSILSLLIAAIGGIPGIIAVTSHFKSSSKFAARPANFILGSIQFNPDPTEYTLVFFSLTVTNEGEKILSPAVFDLAIKIDRRWVKLERRLIPENIHFPSQEQTIEVQAPWKKDLQRFPGTIAHGIPTSGFLFFVTKELTLDELRLMDPIKFRFDCIDVFDRRHRITFTHKGGPIEKNTVYPKHNFSVDVSKDA